MKRSHPPLDHLARLTDGTGLLQHARFSVPDRRHGYCLDDNARALWLTARIAESDDPRVVGLAMTYASFVDHAWDRAAHGGRGRFTNFMSYHRQWLPDGSSGEDEDAQARGLLALAHVISSRLPVSLREWAGMVLAEALRPPSLFLAFGSPRAWAAALVGCDLLTTAKSQPGLVGELQDEVANYIEETAPILAERLLQRFGDAACEDWPWFEDALAYDNARLPEGALAGRRWESELEAVGLRSLRWLCAVQTDGEGRHRPFGNEGFGKVHRAEARYDQQPIEAWATVDACSRAWRLTGDDVWYRWAQAAHDWFTGDNETGHALADEYGGSADGIDASGLNRNRGAESTLAWLHAATTMMQIKATK